MINRFIDFYIKEEVEIDKVWQNDDDDWIEIEDEEYEFAYDGSILYCFILYKNGNISIEEREVTTNYHIFRDNLDDKVFFRSDVLEKKTYDEYDRDTGSKIGLDDVFFVYYFNATSANIVKPLIEKEIKILTTRYIEDFPKIKENYEKSKKNIEDVMTFRKNMDKLKIKDFVNNIEVDENDYVFVKLSVDENELVVKTDIEILSETDMDDIINRKKSLIDDFNGKLSKFRIYPWQLNTVPIYGYKSYKRPLNWNGNSKLINHNLFVFIFKGNKKEFVSSKIVRNYAATKSSYTEIVNQLQKSFFRRKNSYKNCIRIIELFKKGIDIDKYF